jgi:hypothetical protein
LCLTSKLGIAIMLIQVNLSKCQLNFERKALMNKEEILEKSRQSQKDEGIEYAENQGRKIGFMAFSILFAFLIIFNLFFGESCTFHAISSLFWAFIAAESYGKYRFLKQKLYLVTVIAGSMASIISVINYVLTTLR